MSNPRGGLPTVRAQKSRYLRLQQNLPKPCEMPGLRVADVPRNRYFRAGPASSRRKDEGGFAMYQASAEG